MRIRQVKSLVTKEKEILISGGTVLKPEYLDLISFLGIDTVCIEDPYEAFETTHFIISEERKQYYVSEVQKILENHIYHGKNSLNKMTDLANEIVREITEEEQPKVIDIEERNGSLYEHTVLVTMLSLVVAKMLKVKEESYIDIAIGALLHDLGMPSHIKGYQYIRDSIELMYNNPNVLGGITKEVYPFIADKYNTTPSRVERAIRHAIEVSWTRGDYDLMEEIFGHSVDFDRAKPTNSEFLATIADKLSIEAKINGSI